MSHEDLNGATCLRMCEDKTGLYLFVLCAISVVA